MNGFLFCNNCGKNGHLFNKCIKPICSYGIILFKREKKKIKYLMICRKDTLGYIDFLRGKYPINDIKYLQNIIDEMTLDEKIKIVNNSFDSLWLELWGKQTGCKYRGESIMSKEKFSTLKVNNQLKNLINLSETVWKLPEWGFPKGRRNYLESDLTCAIREFEEETGISKKNISVIKNLIPFNEIFMGSNLKSYSHKYYLAYTNCDFLQTFPQIEEVSQIKWATLKEVLQYIRPYNHEKKKLIQRINNVIENYKII